MVACVGFRYLRRALASVAVLSTVDMIDKKEAEQGVLLTPCPLWYMTSFSITPFDRIREDLLCSRIIAMIEAIVIPD